MRILFFEECLHILTYSILAYVYARTLDTGRSVFISLITNQSKVDFLLFKVAIPSLACKRRFGAFSLQHKYFRSHRVDTLSGEQLAGVHLSLNKAIYLDVHDANMINVIECEHVSDSVAAASGACKR